MLTVWQARLHAPRLQNVDGLEKVLEELESETVCLASHFAGAELGVHGVKLGLQLLNLIGGGLWNLVESVVCSLVEHARLLFERLTLDGGVVALAAAHLETSLSYDIELRSNLNFLLECFLSSLFLEFAGDPREGSSVELILEKLVYANLLVVWICLS